MIKSASISLLAPKISSATTGAAVRKPEAATTFRKQSKTTRTYFAFLKRIEVVQILAVTALIGIAVLLVTHVVWINVYSSKGFALKNVQTSIDEQISLQKKLLVQQSMLNSSLSLGEAGQHGLVPVTDVEHLAGNSLAQR